MTQPSTAEILALEAQMREWADGASGKARELEALCVEFEGLTGFRSSDSEQLAIETLRNAVREVEKASEAARNVAEMLTWSATSIVYAPPEDFAPPVSFC